MRFRFVGELGVADRLLMSGIREKGNTEAAESDKKSLYIIQISVQRFQNK